MKTSFNPNILDFPEGTRRAIIGARSTPLGATLWSQKSLYRAHGSPVAGQTRGNSSEKDHYER